MYVLDDAKLGMLQLQAMLRRQWVIKRRSWGSSVAELASPVVLCSMLVLAFSLVHPENRDARIYAGETAELLHNATRDLAATPLASELLACTVLLGNSNSSSNINSSLSSDSGSGGSRRLNAHLKRRPASSGNGEVNCGTHAPGSRCAGDPCKNAKCATNPSAICVPFFCQMPAKFRGVTINQKPCTAVFVDARSQKVVSCSAPKLKSRKAASPKPKASGSHSQRKINPPVTSPQSASITRSSRKSVKVKVTATDIAQPPSRLDSSSTNGAAHTNKATKASTPIIHRKLMRSSTDISELPNDLSSSVGVVGFVERLLAQSLAKNDTTRQEAAFLECFQDAVSSTVSSNDGGAPAIAISALQGFITGNGPLPIPTFDEFVGLSKLLEAALQSSPGALDALHGARRHFGWNLLGNLIDTGKIAFAPATPEVLQFAEYMSTSTEYFAERFHGVFRTEVEAEAYVSSSAERLWALVVFRSGPFVGSDLTDYTIRLNYTTAPPTWIPVTKWRRHLSVYPKQYLSSGFLSIQSAIDGYALGPASGWDYATQLTPPSLPSGTNDSWAQWAEPFPFPAYVHNRFYDAVGPMLGLVMALSLVLPLSMLIRGIVEEKQSGARDLLMVHGLQPWVLPAAWGISYTFIFAIISTAITAVCVLSFLGNTEASLLFALLLAFSLSELAFGMLVGTIFSRAKIAAIVGPLLHFCLLLPRFIFFRADEPQALAAKLVACIAAPTAFTFAADLLAQYEGSGSGMGWGDIFADPLPMAAILGLLLLDAKVYFSLAWYLEQVLPGGYGPRLHWSFVFKFSYWMARAATFQHWVYELCSMVPSVYTRVQTGDACSYGHGADQRGSCDGQPTASQDVESAGDSLPMVCIRRITKSYGATKALRGVDLDLHSGSVTALLGHNGAGKSTLIGILTGTVPATGGDVIVAGRSVVRHPGTLQSTGIGLCPQRNVLFGSLTVQEHLTLMAAIRGITGKHLRHQAAVDSATEIGLSDKLGAQAATLSGGTKRKLQLAMALIGRPAVVVVDEASSGMDTAARQQLQAIVRRTAPKCAMLYSTHYMDEADAVADTIAILASGRLVACGSSISLKEKYGDGYILTTTRDVGVRDADEDDIKRLVSSVVPGAMLQRWGGGELTFRLPTSASALFPDLLDELERHAMRLGIGYYGLSTPSLEEVFLSTTTESKASETSNPSIDRIQTAYVATTGAVTVHSSSRRSSDCSTESESQLRSNSQELRSSKGPGSVGAPDGHLPEPGSSGFRTEFSSGKAVETAPDCLPNETRHRDASHDGMVASPPTASPLPSRAKSRKPDASCGKTSAHADSADESYAEESKAGHSTAGASWRHEGRCFKEMIRKRALGTFRDVRGACFTLLLPIVAVAAVLCILKINIDPTSPSLVLSLETLGQKNAIPVSERPLQFAPQCIQTPDAVTRGARGYGVPNGCGASGMLLSDSANVSGSYQFSQLFLKGLQQGAHPQYAAIAFYDNITSHIQRRVWDASIAAFPEAKNLSDKPFKSLADRLQSSLKPLLLLSQTTPGGRVLQRFMRRLELPAVTLLHNGSSYHALPGLLSDFHELQGSLLSAGNNSSRQGPSRPGVGPSLRVTSHPLPLTATESLQLDTVLAVLAAIFILIPFCYLSGAYAIAPVQERVSGAAHLQRVAGCSAETYWGGHFVWDTATHTVLSLLALAIFAAFGDEATTGSLQKAVGTLALFVAYGLAVIPAAYCLSFSFASPSAAQVSIAAINFVAGFLLVVGSYVMAEIRETQGFQSVAIHFFRLAPPFNLGEGLIQLNVFHLEQGISAARDSAGAAIGAVTAQHHPSVFSWNVLGRPLLLLVLEAAVLGGCALAIDAAVADGTSWTAAIAARMGAAVRLSSRSHAKGAKAGFDSSGTELAALQGGVSSHQPGNGIYSAVVAPGSSPVQVDADVAAECARVHSAESRGDVITLRRLCKNYGGSTKLAVNDLSLGVRPGERFGFLGANGAGKTTTLSILAGQMQPSSGTASVIGATPGSASAAAALGFCPQYDPLLDLLTSYEHLRMYCRLKGVEEGEVEVQVRELQQRVGLPEDHIHRPAHTYSGGNKRKLSLAIALTGRPRVLLLDEPSSGMDPGARRAMWSAIVAATSKAGVAVVLTSHSLEEVEVLCSRVGIMVDGQLACIGSPQHLKSRHGGAYLLHVAAAADATSQAALTEWASERLGATRVNESTTGRAHFLLPLTSCDGDTASRGLSADCTDGHGNSGSHGGHPEGLSTSSTAAPLSDRSALSDKVGRQGNRQTGQAGEGHAVSSHPGSSSDSSGSDVHLVGRSTKGVQEAPAGRNERADQLSLAEVYRRVEVQKTKLGIISFSLTQPTLDQVFMKVVGKPHETDD